MRLTKSFAAFLAAILTLSACATPEPIRSDYCLRANRVELRDLCAPGVRPEITGGGWGSCSITTRADAVRIAQEAEKWTQACARREG